MSGLKEFQKRFIDLAIEYDVLRFGEFTLKSGRKSPYFFNAGNFNSGRALSVMGACYADAIMDSGLEIDLLFGPAYKGIPLVAVTAAALAERHQIDLPYCFNRKEAKYHGEGGNMVGAELKGRALVVDDVITAGTAIREVIDMMEGSDASIGGVLIGLDRQERGARGHRSALGELKEMFGFPVISIIGLEHIRTFIAQEGDRELLKAIDDYREEYGAN
jgi:orotate phosphoribosyltransferase